MGDRQTEQADLPAPDLFRQDAGQEGSAFPLPPGELQSDPLSFRCLPRHPPERQARRNCSHHWNCSHRWRVLPPRHRRSPVPGSRMIFLPGVRMKSLPSDLQVICPPFRHCPGIRMRIQMRRQLRMRERQHRRFHLIDWQTPDLPGPPDRKIPEGGDHLPPAGTDPRPIHCPPGLGLPSVSPEIVSGTWT